MQAEMGEERGADSTLQISDGIIRDTITIILMTIDIIIQGRLKRLWYYYRQDFAGETEVMDSGAPRQGLGYQSTHRWVVVVPGHPPLGTQHSSTAPRHPTHYLLGAV